MQITNPYQSVLKLENLLILNSSFHRCEEEIRDLKLQLGIERSIEEISPQTQYKVSLTLHLGDSDDNLAVSVECVGTFSIENFSDKTIIEKNAVAIMFPYIRSYVSTISTQPGMTPIVIPAININSLFDEDN